MSTPAFGEARALHDRFLMIDTHIEHAVAVMGIDHVGIGCDFDGGGGAFEGLRDVSEYPNVTRALLARGWSEADLAKRWGGNTLRLLRAAAKAAGE